MSHFAQEAGCPAGTQREQCGNYYLIEAILGGSLITAPPNYWMALELRTVAVWGDMTGGTQNNLALPPDNAPEFLNILHQVNRFKGKGRATTAWLDLEPEVPDRGVGFLDMLQGVNGFKNQPYRSSIPASAPACRRETDRRRVRPSDCLSKERTYWKRVGLARDLGGFEFAQPWAQGREPLHPVANEIGELVDGLADRYERIGSLLVKSLHPGCDVGGCDKKRWTGMGAKYPELRSLLSREALVDRLHPLVGLDKPGAPRLPL